MPPLPRLRIRALDELARQLRYAPREALDRHIAAAESLVWELDPAQVYPEDWFVFRLTGYRPEIQDPETFLGEALMSDLSALVERLSVAARHEAGDAGDGALDIEALCARWTVSRKSVERYRRAGLIARRVLAPGGTQRLMFPLASVEAFESRRGDRLGAASGFTRVTPVEEARIVRRARRYQRSLGMSLNQAADRIAHRTGRSHEGVRQVLRRHDERAPARGESPIFTESGPPSARQRAAWARAAARAVEPSLIAERTGRARTSVLRAINIARAERLGALDLESPTLPTFAREDASEVFLGPECVRTGLDITGPTTLDALLAACRERVSVPAPDERARAIAFHFLRFRAARAIAALDLASPSGPALDAIETDLRWGARLKALLMGGVLHLIGSSHESQGARLDAMGARELRSLLFDGVHTIAEAVDRFDTTHGGRLAAASSIAMGRAVTAWRRAHEDASAKSGRAARRLSSGTPAPDWTRVVAPWQIWLEPDPRFRDVIGGLSERDATVLRRRFALDGRPPETLEALAERLGTTRLHAARFEREAIRAALAMARGR